MARSLAESAGVRDVEETLSKEFLREVYHGMDLDGDEEVRKPEFAKAFTATWSAAMARLVAPAAGAEKSEL